MRKHVAFVIPRIGKGGAERVVANIANQMVSDGYPVSIYTILSGEENYKLAEGVNHVHLNVDDPNRLLRMIKRFIKLRSMVKRSDAETVVAFDRYYGILSALFTGKRVIGSERNDPYSNMPRYSIQKHIRDWLYSHVDHVVFQTEYAQNYFSNRIKKRSSIIPNPVSVDILPEPFTGTRDKRIVTACRLTEQKNLPMMIDAFSLFSRVHDGYQLEIYGEGHLLESLKKYTIERGVEKQIRFLGYVDKLPEIINSAAMYVSSSDYEGISNAMLEALAMGLPTVCTDCPAGGAAMVIQNGENGYLVPVKQAEIMAQAMCRVVEDEEHTLAMSKKAIEVRSIFGIQEIAKQWEKVL